MTPTEELREGLEKLGIQYKSVNSEFTVVDMGDIGYRYYQDLDRKRDGMFAVTTWLSPEQVIAATVGNKTCEHVEKPSETPVVEDNHPMCKRMYHPGRTRKNLECSECGYGATDGRWNYCPGCGRKYENTREEAYNDEQYRANR